MAIITAYLFQKEIRLHLEFEITKNVSEKQKKTPDYSLFFSLVCIGPDVYYYTLKATCQHDLSFKKKKKN